VSVRNPPFFNSLDSAAPLTDAVEPSRHRDDLCTGDARLSAGESVD